MRFTNGDYAELVGLYLGDGFITHGPRTDRLRIALDAKYPRINDEARQLLERCFPHNQVHVGPASVGKAVSVSVCSSHLVCLFPQHGHGLKHRRKIELEDWQRAAIAAAPYAFLRGCINSDGCVFVNRTEPYEYLSYEFSNSSTDIARLFVSVAEALALRPRANRDSRGRWSVRINRRESVARLLRHIPIKS